MAKGLPDPKELGFYVSLAQVGMEMVAPVAVGVALDYAFDWRPWGTVIGALLGLVGGVAHLVALVNRHGDNGPSKPGRNRR